MGDGGWDMILGRLTPQLPSTDPHQIHDELSKTDELSCLHHSNQKINHASIILSSFFWHHLYRN
jgi:hypothetical protein